MEDRTMTLEQAIETIGQIHGWSFDDACGAGVLRRLGAYGRECAPVTAVCEHEKAHGVLRGRLLNAAGLGSGL